MGNNKSATTKNAGDSLTILIAIGMRRYDAGRIARTTRPGLHSEPLDAAIGRVPAPYRPGGHHGQLIC
jgi:hypothetical protein